MKIEELKKVLDVFERKLSIECEEFLRIQDKIEYESQRTLVDTDEDLEVDLTTSIEELFRISQTIKSLKDEIEMEELEDWYHNKESSS